MTILPYLDKIPNLHSSVFLAEGARIIGDVEIARDASVWFNAVVRGDVNYVRIGERTNIQDNAVIHVTHKTLPTLVASNVTIGHSAIVHGCVVEEFSLIGMGAILLDGCKIGDHCLVAAGSVIREGFVLPPRTLAAGVPAKIVRELTPEEISRVEESAQHYVEYVSDYRKHYPK